LNSINPCNGPVAYLSFVYQHSCHSFRLLSVLTYDKPAEQDAIASRKLSRSSTKQLNGKKISWIGHVYLKRMNVLVHFWHLFLLLYQRNMNLASGKSDIKPAHTHVLW